MSAGLESRVHLLRASGIEPKHGLGSLSDHLGTTPASSRPGADPADLTDEDALLRLARWLAEVSAEAALAEPAS